MNLPENVELHYDAAQATIELKNASDGPAVLLYHLNKFYNQQPTVLKFEPFFTNKSWKVLEPYVEILNNRRLILDLCTDPWPQDIQTEGPWWLASRQYVTDLALVRSWFPHAIEIHGDMRYFNHDTAERKWYQTIWLYQRNIFDRDDGLASCSRNQRGHWLSCLNRRPLNHRAWWAATFQSQGWINPKNIFSYWGEDPYSGQKASPDSWYLDGVPGMEKKVFRAMIPSFPLQSDPGYRWQNDTTAKNPAYSDAYLNIVTESECDATWFSEKSMKPLTSGQLFVISGGRGSIVGLRQLGFDTFDDIIDHSRYDDLVRWQDRLAAMRDLISTTEDWDWNEIYRATEQRRRKNIDWFWSQEFLDLITAGLRSL